MVGLKEELPGPRDTQSALKKPIARELLYALILAQNAPIIKLEAVYRCRSSGGDSTGEGQSTTSFQQDSGSRDE